MERSFAVLVHHQIGSSDWSKGLDGLKMSADIFVILSSKELGSDFAQQVTDKTRSSVIGMKLKPIKKVASGQNDFKSKPTSSNEISKLESDFVNVSEGSEKEEATTRARIEKLVSKVGQPVMIRMPNPKAEPVSQEDLLPESSLNSDLALGEGRPKQREEQQVKELPHQELPQQHEQQQLQQTSASVKAETRLRPTPPPKRPIQLNPDQDNLVRMIFSEQRLQNADMRMSVKRVEDKLDELINRLTTSSSGDDKPINSGQGRPDKGRLDQADFDDKLSKTLSELDESKKMIVEFESKIETLQNNLELQKVENEKLKIRLTEIVERTKEEMESALTKNSDLEKNLEMIEHRNKVLVSENDSFKDQLLKDETSSKREIQADVNINVDATRRNVRKIVSKVFKLIRSEMIGDDKIDDEAVDVAVVVEKIANHFRNVTEQILSESHPA